MPERSCMLQAQAANSADFDCHAGSLPKQADTGIDSAGSASTVVLREIHCALLRVIQSQGMERDRKEVSKGQPSTAKLFSPDSSGPVPWTAQVAQTILAAPAAGAAASAKVRLACLAIACLCIASMCISKAHMKACHGLHTPTVNNMPGMPMTLFLHYALPGASAELHKVQGTDTYCLLYMTGCSIDMLHLQRKSAQRAHANYHACSDVAAGRCD